ncbi:MAG TPA: bifunctional diaminohydroxyphosphoribosylaminopyrimidine deaminase/5-amino-6-(5-phosphoribosylamino)uracil reductase RibD [Bacteroidales bacterium]|nr:bifunctional diaminohydroxyphosphoribosylaminopyrimidine deaminase/5-amino-6-(5-phosphoribosylamino)uracil reductase RibD [Bacteroidales bacterium]
MKEELYIRRCLELAGLGGGSVSPNPMVGALVVYKDEIIGQGYHKAYGLSHAEPNAINSVEDKTLLKDSVLYVNLEPCSHWGKTPPCADLIANSGIRRVVISNTDPNPKVFGGGIKILKDAGIEVITGVLEKEGRELNKRFFSRHEKNRPYIILKWAQTLDGFMDIDRREGSIEPYWITNDALKLWVHKQRAMEDCILVGKNTIINDNPRLNVRHYYGSNPIRMTIDRELTIPKDCFFMDNTQKTIIFNSIKDFVDGEITYVKLDFEKKVLDQIIHYIYNDIKASSLIVEGGRFTLMEFMNKNLWDEANVLVGNKFFKKGLLSPKNLLERKPMEKILFGEDWIEKYINK